MSMAMMGALTMDDCVATSSCPVGGGFVAVPPHLAGNAILLAAFSALIPINLFFGIRYRMPLYASFFIIGLILEVLGHIGRIMLRDDLASRSYYLMATLGAATGPTFVSAAIFVVLPHILAIYGDRFFVIPSPLWIGLCFFGFDVFTLTFQIVGCVFFVNGVTSPEMAQGINILLAGMGIQIASIVLYFVAYYWFLARLTRHHELLERRHEAIYLTGRFKIFLLCLQFAAILILARTISRIVQLCSGYSSVVFQSQTINMVLDSSVVLIACIVLTLAPPGVTFGRTAWKLTSPHLLGVRRRGGDYALQSSSSQQHRSPYYYNSPSSTAPSYGHHNYYNQQDQPHPSYSSHREPKPFEHQVPAHWQFPNLHKSAPRPKPPKPVAVPKFEDTPEGRAFYSGLGSAGSQGNAGARRDGAKRMSPGQRDLVDEEALW